MSKNNNDSERLCASDDPAFKSQIAALKTVTEILNQDIHHQKEEEDLSPEQLAAITRFAARAGAEWKYRLSTAWTTGKDASMPDGHLLRQVRNEHGPEWLENFTLA